jgi:hypothetical protein
MAQKQKAVLTGFSGYTIFNDGTILNSLGKPVTVKDGKVTLTASDDVPEAKIVKGKRYPYAVDALLKACDGGWEDVAETPVAPTVTLTPEQIAAQEKKDAKKAAKKKLDEIKEKFVNNRDDSKWGELRSEMDAAQKAYDELADVVATVELTDEQKELVKAYEEKYAAYEDIKATLEGVRVEVKEAKEAVEASGAKVKGTSVSERAPHLGYDIAQKMRAMYAIGRFDGQPADKQHTVKEIAEKFGSSTQAVIYKVNYLQHKLRKNDDRVVDGVVMNKPYTPLVNDYYNDHVNSGFPSGAPYEEDAVIETPERYLLPKSRKARAVKVAA